MRVLLLAMPDVASCFDRVMRFPNLGLASLAANVDDAEVRILDLVLRPRDVGRAVREALARFSPDLVGLSAMTFQYDTAKQVAEIVREALPSARTVLGGYHATLAYEEIAADPGAHVFDFLVRGEGEAALNSLVRARRIGEGYTAISGLSYRAAAGFVHNERGPPLDVDSLRLPARSSRMENGFAYFGKPFDVVETSRGCTRGCRFCCIHKMYGVCHRTYPIERVIRDIQAAADGGARGVFFSDDNINLDPNAYRILLNGQELCAAIVEAGLHRLEYVTQADVAGFARAPHLAAAMSHAGFKGMFLGIESVDRGNWKFLRKSNSLEKTQEVITNLRAHGIGVAGGFIVGNPDEDEAAVRGLFRTARTLEMDHAIMWYPRAWSRTRTTIAGTTATSAMYARGISPIGSSSG